MGYYTSMDPAMDGAITGEQGGIIAQFMAKIPVGMQVVINVMMVIVVAAIAGMIIGRMYASIKYPDPEKHHIISPKLRVLFICILAACCVWLYATMIREKAPAPEQDMMDQDSGGDTDMPDGIDYGGKAVMAMG